MSEQSNNQGSPPIKSFRSGRVQAAVFERQTERDGQTVIEHSVKIDKRYQHKDGNWQSTTNFFPAELPKLILVVQEANRFLNLREVEPSNSAA